MRVSMAGRWTTGPVNVLLCGIGGYGFHYLESLLEMSVRDEVRLVGAVDPGTETAPARRLLAGLAVPVFDSLEAFFESGRRPHLTVVSSPLHYHIPLVSAALKEGSHVLCEKPLGVRIQDVDALIQIKNLSGREVMVGYQWSYSRAIQSLKQDILAGKFGAPVRGGTLCFWPRDLAYYRRNDWAGRIKTDAGEWILDSPANNAMAHFLHNLLYLLGDRLELSAVPFSVAAERFRVFPIENYDSIACRIRTSRDTPLMFCAAHPAEEDKGPMFYLEFERAGINCSGPGQPIISLDREGERTDYGSPDDTPHFFKLTQALEVVRGRSGVVCGPEASRSLTLCVNGIQESGDIIALPAEMIRHDPTSGTSAAPELTDSLFLCYRKGKLPSELREDWAVGGRVVRLGRYDYFPGGNAPAERRKKSD